MGRRYYGLVFLGTILALHRGSSARRAYNSVALSAALIALPMWAYCRFLGPAMFLPQDDMLYLSPYALGPYGFGLARGWTAAKSRDGTDPIVLEGYGFGGDGTPAAPRFTAETLQQHAIRIETIALCFVDSYTQGHARGYNMAAVREIKRRRGAEVIAAAEREEAKRQQDYADGQKVGRASAEGDSKAGGLAMVANRRNIDGEDDFRRLLADRHGIELIQPPSEVIEQGDQRTMGWRSGYNEVAFLEIKRRLGDKAADTANAASYGGSYKQFIDYEQFMADQQARQANATNSPAPSR